MILNPRFSQPLFLLNYKNDMVDPTRIGLVPSALQADARTSYARSPFLLALLGLNLNYRREKVMN